MKISRCTGGAGSVRVSGNQVGPSQGCGVRQEAGVWRRQRGRQRQVGLRVLTAQIWRPDSPKIIWPKTWHRRHDRVPAPHAICRGEGVASAQGALQEPQRTHPRQNAAVARGRGRSGGSSGGLGGGAGGGETELQLQRRRVDARRKALLLKLADVRRTRAVQRAARRRSGKPLVAVVVGDESGLMDGQHVIVCPPTKGARYSLRAAHPCRSTRCGTASADVIAAEGARFNALSQRSSRPSAGLVTSLRGPITRPPGCWANLTAAAPQLPPELQRGVSAASALQGYTNAGKSSLIESLTGADLGAADALFATLDATARVTLQFPEIVNCRVHLLETSMRRGSFAVRELVHGRSDWVHSFRAGRHAAQWRGRHPVGHRGLHQRPAGAAPGRLQGAALLSADPCRLSMCRLSHNIVGYRLSAWCCSLAALQPGPWQRF